MADTPQNKSSDHVSLSLGYVPSLPNNVKTPNNRKLFAKLGIVTFILAVIVNGVLISGFLPILWMRILAGVNMVLSTLSYVFFEWAKPPMFRRRKPSTKTKAKSKKTK